MPGQDPLHYYMLALEIKNFTKQYGSTLAVNNISLAIKPGEFFGFLGQNGAGKTSTINCTTGISTITNGTIKVFGIDVVQEYRAARRKVGLSPQEFHMDIFATVYNILWYMGGFYSIPAPARQQRIEELLARFDLGPHRHKPFRALSGGLKRRLTIARALIHDPDLLILDEPTAGVDVEQRHDLWKYLQELNQAGKTILLTSHYLEEVEMLCNRIAVIHQGKIIEEGDKADFIKNGSTLEQTYLKLTAS